MYRRIIPCLVTDEYVQGDGVVVGAAGSHDDVALRLSFGPMWAGTTKSIVWKDALGQNPTITNLTTNLLEDGETEVYIVPIPAEPKAVSGEMSMTIKGVTVSGTKQDTATLTTTARFTVMESDWDDDAQSSGDINPAQAEQLQAQIDDIKNNIQEAAAAADAKEAAQNAQALAEAAKTQTEAIRDNAAGYASQAENFMRGAESFADEAQKEADRAKQFADTANIKAESWAVGGTGSRDGEDTNNAKYWAGFAQAQAESVNVPAAEGVYNVVLQDRAVSADRYALIVENGVLKLLGVKDTVDAATPTLIDTTSGTGWKLAVENGRLLIEEV